MSSESDSSPVEVLHRPFAVELDRFHRARARIQSFIRHTPLAPLPHLRDRAPALHLKLENLQVTGSFKARGAFNNLLQASSEGAVKGVIVASGGNHGYAVAYAAKKLKIPATVVLPTTASADRIERIRRWGADVQLFGENPSDALRHAAKAAEAEQLLFVHPFDAERTIEGAGTLGLEILADFPEVDAVLIAVGGGGLLAGVGSVLKAVRPDIQVIAVEPTGAASLKVSVDAGKVVALSRTNTIADTLSPRAVSERTLSLAQQCMDQLVLVEDEEMVEAMKWLWEEVNQLVEPAGAAVLAAVLAGRVDLSRYKNPLAIICGGNAAAGPVFERYLSAARDLSR